MAYTKIRNGLPFELRSVSAAALLPRARRVPLARFVHTQDSAVLRRLWNLTKVPAEQAFVIDQLTILSRSEPRLQAFWRDSLQWAALEHEDAALWHLLRKFYLENRNMLIDSKFLVHLFSFYLDKGEYQRLEGCASQLAEFISESDLNELLSHYIKDFPKFLEIVTAISKVSKKAQFDRHSIVSRVSMRRYGKASPSELSDLFKIQCRLLEKRILPETPDLIGMMCLTASTNLEIPECSQFMDQVSNLYESCWVNWDFVLGMMNYSITFKWQEFKDFWTIFFSKSPKGFYLNNHSFWRTLNRKLFEKNAVELPKFFQVSNAFLFKQSNCGSFLELLKKNYKFHEVVERQLSTYFVRQNYKRFDKIMNPISKDFFENFDRFLDQKRKNPYLMSPRMLGLFIKRQCQLRHHEKVYELMQKILESQPAWKNSELFKEYQTRMLLGYITSLRKSDFGFIMQVLKQYPDSELSNEILVLFLERDDVGKSLSFLQVVVEQFKQGGAQTCKIIRINGRLLVKISQFLMRHRNEDLQTIEDFLVDAVNENSKNLPVDLWRNILRIQIKRLEFSEFEAYIMWIIGQQSFESDGLQAKRWCQKVFTDALLYDIAKTGLDSGLKVLKRLQKLNLIEMSLKFEKNLHDLVNKTKNLSQNSMKESN